MLEFKGYGGGKVTIDGDNVFIKQMFIKENCTLNDIAAIKFIEPQIMTNGQLLIQTKTQTHTIIFLKSNRDLFMELYTLIKQHCPEVQETASAPTLGTAKDKLCCPNCKSLNLQVMGNDRKAFSVGKSVAGTVLTGGVGALAGFAGKKGKYDMFCADCGHRFQVK